jgi:protein disulfide-isomerase
MKNLVALIALLAIGSTLADVPPKLPNLASKKERQKSEKLPPCKSCSLLVKTFKEGMERTARSKHDGGDAAWEEQKLGSYSTSEIRLVEIQESMCNDIGRGEDQCHGMAEQFEHDIEEWWFKHQTTEPDLYKWLCIDKAEMCCPDGRYGPQCRPCVDCSGNGRCKGNGTRKGNGKCACDTGYTGEACNQCEVGYYEAFRDASKLLCTSCHPACKTSAGCDGPGPKSKQHFLIREFNFQFPTLIFQTVRSATRAGSWRRGASTSTNARPIQTFAK